MRRAAASGSARSPSERHVEPVFVAEPAGTAG